MVVPGSEYIRAADAADCRPPNKRLGPYMPQPQTGDPFPNSGARATAPVVRGLCRPVPSSSPVLPAGGFFCVNVVGQRVADSFLVEQ